jgi:hypothetical protein
MIVAPMFCFFYQPVLVLHMFIEAEVVDALFQRIRVVVSACQKNPYLRRNTQTASRQTMYSWGKNR